MPICRFWVICCLLLTAQGVSAQSMLRGTIFNMNKTQPLAGVSVMTTQGRGTVTDDNGRYSIEVGPSDSIYFSYLNKPTVKYPIAQINLQNNFDLALHIPVTELKEVRVMPRNYRMDSLQNRLDYAKVFNYRKPGLKIVSPTTPGAAVGLDLDEIINVFRFRRNQSMQAFQRRLLQEEQDKFIDFRFNKPLVRKLTLLKNAELDEYMRLYRPPYEFTQISTDYEFGMYILQTSRAYKEGQRPKLYNPQIKLK
jgi:hypothetical protein